MQEKLKNFFRKMYFQFLFLLEFLSYAKQPSAKAVESFILLVRRARRGATTTLYYEMLEHIKSDQDAKQLIEERYLPRQNSLLELQRYPKLSLGAEFARHLSENNLELEIYAQFEIESEIEYISFRGGQLHDIWHVVTGYGVDYFGEFAVQAFTFAQTKSPIVAMFLAGDLLFSSRKGPAFSFRALQAITDGFLLGCRLRNFYGVRWEDCFSKNLNDLRTELGIGSSAPYIACEELSFL